MKQKISVTIDEATLKKVEEHISSGVFRNKSHALEYEVRKLLEK